MLPITYYFWNSYKKSGYVRGKLDRAEYDKQVSQGGKDSNVFVKKLVENVLEDQKETVNEAITTLEIETNNADKELKKIQLLKTEEENKASEMFTHKKAILEQEKYKIEEDFANNSLLEVQQLKKAKEILGNLSEFLGTYAEEIKKGVTMQSERLLGQRKSALKHNTKLTAQEIKENITQKEKSNDGSKKTNDKLGNSLGHLIFLSLICVFDIILGYGVTSEIVEMYDNVIFLSKNLAAVLLAILIIPLIIYILHASVKGIGGAENKNMKKQLGVLSVVFTVFIVILYILQSAPELLSSVFGKTLGNTLTTKPEILFRAFLLPSLFAGEIVIGLIDWDSILDYFGIGKKKGANSLSRLITNGLYFLKSKKISNYAKEEKKAIENLINEMQKEEVPAFAEIKKDISEIQSILDPIWNKQSEKFEEYKGKISEIKNKMEKNLSEYNSNLQSIANKYAEEIGRFESIKRINEAKINKLNHDFNQASIDVKEGILIGLIDK